jgi:cytidylate kinase
VAHAESQAGQAAVAEAIQARDLSDTTRTASPLALAPGAARIDTTDMPIEAVIDRVMALVKDRLSRHGSKA